MTQTGLSIECKDLALIIENLASGKETCEIGDTRYSLEDVLDYLRGYLQELQNLDLLLARQGNTQELLEKVHEKYTELWLFQLSFTVESLPRVIGRLWRYPNSEERRHMNFLDAHKILHDYISTFNSSAAIEGVLRRESVLKNTKKDILNSYKIFLAHMFIFHTRTQEEYEALQMLINELPSFVNDKIIDQYLECKRIIEDKSLLGKLKNKAAYPLAKEKMQRILIEASNNSLAFYSSDESIALDKYTAAIHDLAIKMYKETRNLDLTNHEDWTQYITKLFEYCRSAYALAEIPEGQNDIDFFYPFSRLKQLAVCADCKELFAPYKAYIFAHDK